MTIKNKRRGKKLHKLDPVHKAVVQETLEILEPPAQGYPGYLWQTQNPASIWVLLHSSCHSESCRERLQALDYILPGGAFAHKMLPWLLHRVCFTKGLC